MKNSRNRLSLFNCKPGDMLLNHSSDEKIKNALVVSIYDLSVEKQFLTKKERKLDLVACMEDGSFSFLTHITAQGISIPKGYVLISC